GTAMAASTDPTIHARRLLRLLMASLRRRSDDAWSFVLRASSSSERKAAPYHEGCARLKDRRAVSDSTRRVRLRRLARLALEQRLLLEPGLACGGVRLAPLERVGQLARDLLEARQVELGGDLQETDVSQSETLAVVLEDVGDEL